ncbi:MAG: SpoIIE family protein phosphatase [Bryobacteraceae bacterium]|jgi:sigma-B regulation protein RsbU (phosphoserine phosphatase)
MASPGWLKTLRGAGWLEKLFAAGVLASLAAQWLAPGRAAAALLQLATFVLGFLLLWRHGLRVVRRLIWRLRNRLIVAYVFIAAVPMLMLGVLTLAGAWVISGQIAAYLLSVEMGRRVSSLQALAESLERAAPQVRVEAVRRAGFFVRDRFPGAEILLRDESGREVRYPEDAGLPHPPPGHERTAGLLIREGRFYLWAHGGGERSEVVITVPVTRAFLQGLAPGLGAVQLTPFAIGPQGVRAIEAAVHPPLEGEPPAGAAVVPEPANLLDLPLKWGVTVRASVWDEPERPATVFLGAATRISGPLRIMFSVDTSSSGPTMLVLFSTALMVFFIVEVSSVWIGVSLSRTITSAVNDLYEATVKIRSGDLSHRIEVKGNDQLAELGTSFNIMAGNLERLLLAEKERQRLQAELEIAREVQSQLLPKPIREFGSLRIASVCNAARMVSGDYFDYQPLSEGRLALALGDVAGKGISAALLMATLQSAMRSQLRQCMEAAEAAAAGRGAGYDPPQVSTARLVSNLNQQLYASTAPEKYATFFFSVYDEATSELVYTNAGHLPPLLVRGGEIRPLDTNGMVVGCFAGAKYGESRLRLEPGDLLVCYTDGVTEPENAYGEMFGEPRLKALLAEHASMDIDELGKRIADEVARWTASSELQDDFTLLLVRKTG